MTPSVNTPGQPRCRQHHQRTETTLGEHDVSENARLEAVRSAADRGISGLDAGQGVDVAPGGVREYLRARGRLATERADAQTA